RPRRGTTRGCRCCPSHTSWLVSFSLSVCIVPAEPMEEHLEAGLDAGRDADQLAGTRQPGHGRQHAADPFDGVLSTIGEAADPLHLSSRFLAEATELVNEPTHLADERTELTLENGEHAVGALGRPAQRDDRRHQGDGDGDQTRDDEPLKPGLHGEGIMPYLVRIYVPG